jgi:hydantoinase/carbamoylase family amidase
MSGVTVGVNAQIEELSQINSDPAAGGITREVFTSEYMAANDYVSNLMQDAGLTVRLDAFGNLFGRLAGSDPSATAIMTGSHIDTTLNAGRFDGVLGVLGAIEAVRQLSSEGPTLRPIEVVVFAGEEPRFGSGCIGSRVLIGQLSRQDLDTMKDRSGVSIAEAMRDVELDPDQVREARLDGSRVKAFVEFHIEQGSVLERLGVPIGVVKGPGADNSRRRHADGRAPRRARGSGRSGRRARATGSRVAERHDRGDRRRDQRVTGSDQCDSR